MSAPRIVVVTQVLPSGPSVEASARSPELPEGVPLLDDVDPEPPELLPPDDEVPGTTPLDVAPESDPPSVPSSSMPQAYTLEVTRPQPTRTSILRAPSFIRSV